MVDECEAVEPKRSSPALCRFHVTHPEYGLIEATANRAHAFTVAEFWDNAERTGYPEHGVEVFDNMAKKGKPQLWRRLPKGAEHCWEHGDFYTERSIWKCIRRRGGITLTNPHRSYWMHQRKPNYWETQ